MRVAESHGGEALGIIALARAEAESLIQRHVSQIRKLANELMQAKGHELSGEQVEGILAAAGVQRGAHNHQDIKTRSSVTAKPQPGREFYLERPVSLRRTDGWVA
jgi:hypothetical protein